MSIKLSIKGRNEKVNCLLFVGIIVSIAFVVFLYFWYNMGTFAKSNANVFSSFAALVSAFLVPLWSAIAAYLYYWALQEQRKQIAVMQIQHFNSEFFSLIEQQVKMRDNIKTRLVVVFEKQNVFENREVEYNGLFAFQALEQKNKDIAEFITSGDFKLDEYKRDDFFYPQEQTESDKIFEHEDQTKYLQQEAKKTKRRKVVCSARDYVSKDYQPDGTLESIQAFRLLYRKYSAQLNVYFHHLIFVLKYLKEECNKSEEIKDRYQFYLTAIRANLSYSEIYFLVHYNECCIPQGFFNDLISQYKKNFNL